MHAECMLWRKKKQTNVSDGERDVDMGGVSQPAANNPPGTGGSLNLVSDGTAISTLTNDMDENAAAAGTLVALPPTNDTVPPRFQLKRWSACVYWSWDVMHDTCVICRNAMMSLCIHCQAKVGTNPLDEVCAVAWGVCNHAYHLHCIKRWLETSAHPRCPLDNSEWEFSRIGQ
ncbi:Ubiquitin ligase subunit HrtA [Fasciola gigantica]|uniref:Ubiquitin ligase subunit HrtA n=1 Tax=Fasciola gigantica TaxID=46835 RepID=A0A504YEA5_FASGI|nr:Ubiquitin ligase subunit HrtA [Fasciola gigantica]